MPLTLKLPTYTDKHTQSMAVLRKRIWNLLVGPESYSKWRLILKQTLRFSIANELNGTVLGVFKGYTHLSSKGENG